jgi:hypothetical protein
MGNVPMDGRKRQCTARSKRSGEQCKRLASVGHNVCAMHGSKTPRGPAHPSYKHGKHSKVLPQRMRQDYERAIADEELMSLRSEIAVLDARITDLLTRADSGESGHLWRQLSAQMRTVDASPDPESAQIAMTKLQQIIAAGSADGALWDEIRDALLTRERLVRSERKHLVEAHLVIPLEQAQLLMTLFVDAAKEAVGHDPAVMGKIVEAFVRLTGYDPTSRQIIGAGGRDT